MGRKAILSYQGPLTFSTIAWLVSEFKMAAQDNALSYRSYKKMISVMIEALENVSRYCSRPDHDTWVMETYPPSFQISLIDGMVELFTRNPVRKKDGGAVRDQIDHVNSHQGVALRKLYRTTMSNGKFTESGGAGLGFIEMARRSGGTLEYSFEELTGEYELYTLLVKVEE